MYEKVTDRSDGEYPSPVLSDCADTQKVLDARVDQFSRLVKEYYKLPELGDPSISTEVHSIAKDVRTMLT